MRPPSTQRSISRRRFLTASLSVGGAGLTLPEVLRLRAATSPAPRKTSVIQIWLGGGPSQFETFDPKPDAPSEIRGPYEAISSRLPGVLVSETMPLTAGVLDRTAIVRSFTHAIDDHFGVTRWCLAGRREPDSRNGTPCVGSVASRFRGPRDPGVPAYTLLSEEPVLHHHLFDVHNPGYLGVSHAPFTVLQDPYAVGFQMPRLRTAVGSLEIANDVTLDRITDRRALFTHLDELPRQLDLHRSSDGDDPYVQLALDLVTSGKTRRAFDLNEEPQSVRERYGSHRWGQMALLSRRLVEAGVTFVTINTAPDCLRWDFHVSVTREQRPQPDAGGPHVGMESNGPPLDRALAALITDLSERSSCRNVLLIVWGEFGRTPKVNATGGRDHWPRLGSVLFAGGAVRTGQVIGASDPSGGMPVDRPVGPDDLLATVYQHLGIDPQLQMIDRQGRPIAILPEGTSIRELL